MALYEIISGDEYAEIMDGQAALDGGGESGDESSEGPADDDEKDEKADKSKGKSRGKASKDDDSGEGPSDEGGGGQKDGDWYSTGYGEVEKVSDREAAGGDDKAWRFFLRAGEETEVIILDSGPDDMKRWDRLAAAPFNVWEHNFAVQNDPNDPNDMTFHDLTCVRGKLNKEGKPRRCYVCERKKKIRRRFRSMYSVLAKYEGRKGEAWSKKLLPADKSCLKKLKRHAKKGGLFGMKFNVFRSDDRSSRIGDDWSYDSTMSEDEVQELLGDRQDLSPVNYVEECRPMTWDELETLLKDAIISDPKTKKKGKGKGKRQSDDDDKPRGRDDDDKPRRRSDEEQEDRPKRRARDDEKDEESEEKPARRRPKDEDEDKPRRRAAREEKDEEPEEGEEGEEEGEEEGAESEEEEAPTGRSSGSTDGDDIPF